MRHMPSESPIDVPSPIDFRLMSEAREWAKSVNSRRPSREQMFDRIVRELSERPATDLRLLELGSGPGFLAERVLRAFPGASYTALDFSPAMHLLARERLGPLARNVLFREADFRTDDWCAGLGAFDAVLTVQAVHELRHKRRAPGLYAQVAGLLRPSGVFLMCDHFVGERGMTNRSLYMTIDEQKAALEAGGFGCVDVILEDRGLVLLRASVGGRGQVRA